MQFYSKHEDRIKNRLDILNYLQFSNRLDILSSLIQSKVQNLCLKNMSKMGNLSDEYITFWVMTREELIELDAFLKADGSSKTDMDKKILDVYASLIDRSYP